MVLTNSDSANAPELATRILRIVLSLPEHEHKESVVDPKVFDSYVGTWQLGDFRMTLAREDHRMFVQIRERKIPLSPQTVRDYVLPSGDTHLIFATNGNNRPTQVILREGGSDAYLSRMQ